MQRPGQVVIAIVGPTCTGKTSLSLAMAKRLDGEIVACDSRTVYKRMDIGTAKPTRAEQAAVRHHAIDVLAPNRFFSVAEYKELALRAIEDIFDRGKTPIVCGGSGLYARALLQGISIPSVPPQPELRHYFNALASEKGNLHLHEELKRVDAITAQRLSINDRRRIIRALEVSFVSGKAFSELAIKVEPPFKTIWIGLCFRERGLHKGKIIERLDQQFAQGLAEEATSLLAEPEFAAILGSAVNYKEFLPYVNGRTTLTHVFDQCVLHNFQLARKQMTWFQANKQISWYDLGSVGQEEILAQVVNSYRTAMSENGINPQR